MKLFWLLGVHGAKKVKNHWHRPRRILFKQEVARGPQDDSGQEPEEWPGSAVRQPIYPLSGQGFQQSNQLRWISQLVQEERFGRKICQQNDFVLYLNR